MVVQVAVVQLVMAQLVVVQAVVVQLVVVQLVVVQLVVVQVAVVQMVVVQVLAVQVAVAQAAKWLEFGCWGNHELTKFGLCSLSSVGISASDWWLTPLDVPALGSSGSCQNLHPGDCFKYHG